MLWQQDSYNISTINILLGINLDYEEFKYVEIIKLIYILQLEN